jgi:hypothetical protein
MASKLKRDQISPQRANNWRKSFKEEAKFTFNIEVPQIVLQKETYKILAGENENRLRIYLGLEPVVEGEKLKLCAFAVSAFLLGSGDVYVDYETPVYWLGKENIDYSMKTGEVIDNIKRYRSWLMGEIDSENETASFRQYIYPSAYLLTKFELHDIFNVQNKKEAQIEFGISKTMNVMILPDVVENREVDDTSIVFNNGGQCPPICDNGSIYNP